MAHGGKRENAGRKKGAKNAKTIKRDKVFAELQQRTMRVADILFESQLSIARGEYFLFRVDRNAEYGHRVVLITNELTMRAYLEGRLKNIESVDYICIVTKEPNNQAINSLLDRVFGKPTKTIDVVSGGEPIALLKNTRE